MRKSEAPSRRRASGPPALGGSGGGAMR
eukprot:COSAG04_NODE_27366_length_284_cov_0.513514_1_plen_27_part_01